MAADNQIHVLYVEDDLITAKAISRQLAPEGFVVEHTKTLADAGPLLKSVPFDVLLLDLGLEESGGAETVRRARALTKLPIVVFTGMNVEPDDKLAMEVIGAGADFYVEKTAGVKEVRRTLRLSLMRKILEGNTQGRSDICGRIIKIEREGALVCYCLPCDKVCFVVESNMGPLVCPHCSQRTMMQWGQARFQFEPELPAKYLLKKA